jgi:hypothetical protein
MTHERFESDREDLLAEATALVDRVEWSVAGFAAPIVIGFRKRGDASIFLGADPVYQFTAAGALRRAYVSGQLIKAVGGRLVAMTRRRTATEVELHSRELSTEEQTAMLARLAEEIGAIRRAVEAGDCQLLREISRPDRRAVDAAAHTRATDWLRTITLPPKIAAAPNASR